MRKKYNKDIPLKLGLAIFLMTIIWQLPVTEPGIPSLKIGIITDCQYSSDHSNKNNKIKLQSAITTLNKHHHSHLNYIVDNMFERLIGFCLPGNTFQKRRV